MSDPIQYIARTRHYYATLGYPPYTWAHFDDVPFTPMPRPLKEARLALVTTAAPYKLELGDQGPGAAYNAAAKFYQVYRAPLAPQPNLRISHLGYDRVHTTAQDPRTWLPIDALRRAQQNGQIASLADDLIGMPTNRSQRVTLEQDAPDVLAAVRDQHADVALLVAN